jgi:uncharacterized protein (DUF488 family)
MRAHSAVTVHTIGHSTRPLETFVAMLRAHGITRLVDIRTVPRSRHNPQFNRETLPGALGDAHLRYVHLPGLGGHRRPRADSPNTAWRNTGFRGYADYMQTPEFEASLARLIAEAHDAQVAIMCAEAVPWRCHRSLVSDALVTRGHRVLHIMSAERADPHALTRFARLEHGRVTYPPPQSLGLPFGAS